MSDNNSENNPLVSVIIPYYNLPEYIDEAVASVTSQTYQNLEIIIIDDGSTQPEAKAKISQYNMPADKRIILHQKSNSGLAATRNYGIAKAKGQFICCLDADDVYAQDYIEKAVAHFKDENTGAVTSHIQTFGEISEQWEMEEYDVAKLMLYNCLHVASVFRKEVWEKNQGYDENMRIGYQDWEFWINMIDNGYKWEIIPEYLFHYRKRGTSMIDNSTQHDAEIFSYIYDKHRELYQRHAESVIKQSRQEVTNKNLKFAKTRRELIAQKQELEKKLQEVENKLTAKHQEIEGLKTALDSTLKSKRVRLGAIVAEARYSFKNLLLMPIRLIKLILRP